MQKFSEFCQLPKSVRVAEDTGDFLPSCSSWVPLVQGVWETQGCILLDTAPAEYF
jgi:hypothetical protein